MKKYFMIMAFAIVNAAFFGFIFPMLFSAKDDMYPILALLLLIVIAPLDWMAIQKIFKPTQPKEETNQ